MPPPAAPGAALQRQRLLSEKPCVMRDDDADPREVSLHPRHLSLLASALVEEREGGRHGEGGREGWWNVRMNAMGGASAMHEGGVLHGSNAPSMDEGCVCHA
jgi:hypothetical protein